MNYNKSTRLTNSILYIIIFIFLFLQGNIFTYAQVSKTEIEQKITSKGEELKKINEQILENQKKLTETQSQKQSLTTEVKKIDSTIKQIDLGIKSSEIVIDKLGYEIESLQGDISESEKDVNQKEIAIGDIFRDLQNKDNETLLISLLKNKTLSQSVFEIQTLSDVNKKLVEKIDELNKAKKKLSGTLQVTATTKDNKEIEKENLKNKKSIATDVKQEKSNFLAQTKNKEQIYQNSLKELEKKQLEIALEIEKMDSQLRGQIDYKNLPKKAPGLLLRPVKGPITQDYGATKFAQKAYAGKWHNGLDFGAPIGEPIYASADGVVVSVENQDKYCNKGAYGKYVAIKHNIGLTTISAHMSMYTVKEGDIVKKGQIIGYVGKTGFATGPHLHFTVYDSSTFRIGPSNSCGPKMPFGGDINPRNYVSL